MFVFRWWSWRQTWWQTGLPLQSSLLSSFSWLPCTQGGQHFLSALQCWFLKSASVCLSVCLSAIQSPYQPTQPPSIFWPVPTTSSHHRPRDVDAGQEGLLLQIIILMSLQMMTMMMQGWLKVTYNVEIPTFKYEKIELLVCIYEISRELVFIYGISGCSRCLTPATIVNPIPFHPKFIWDSYSQANWSNKCSPLKWWLIHTYGRWANSIEVDCTP